MKNKKYKIDKDERLVGIIKMAFEQYYRKVISDNIKRSLAQKRAKLSTNPKVAL
ncbi:MAG: hypothetical protein UX49_C0021G0006 [Candidatus Wolfebacteria bacterium GW2011_GWC2_46_275]|uniref:Uncharacterized protein n=2 Tax=Candidatus Wolfeibacteriota TaxID=1752735 RepID=A0A0G1U8U0_9BACT|nr:MAG: hypothetical protein UX70_C0001G0813 [Candidatus Wolfebacteria bacterium GW2011_GWB1_47_1]KKU36182.1 MAG: hypothetical protein UX49_C0021G0006 [Candidatus Wolfebacteria bacterium GW2011_GWC2_46_275]KKU66060.1 MAG: hypothetical protein UX90_C0001G0119 [Candidatus Wolfebacteria bacterium GW2011_GWD2_47_17]KKU76778.1 MAG: hypothetical protein UY00_C0003G0007 [Candidatus Wolfebacteria bacterium GW2011_GWA1_47_6]KKU90547.1 MAG: hypothetical protein UY19_C0001G0024 [Candidatus Wolfebacteria b